MVDPKPAVAEVRFPIEGMTCASCVNRIERHLGKLDGVESAAVNLATESASVRYDPQRIELSDLGRAVEAAGYDARLDRAEGDGAGADGEGLERTVALDIEGMTCASCVNRIERHLRKVDGVESAAVNLATERATVVAAPAVTTGDILAAVEAAGYAARLLAEGEPEAPAPALAEPHAADREASPATETSFQRRHVGGATCAGGSSWPSS